MAFLLVLLNGFFVAAEFSLVKVRKTRLAELEENGSKRASIALKVTSHLDAYLSACQLGITLASLGLGWLGEPAIASLIEPLFINIAGWSEVYTHSIAVIVAFIFITFLHIVLGELVPKSLAIQKAEGISLALSGILNFFYKIFYPAIYVLNKIANLILRAWGISPANESDLAHTEEELRMLVDASQRHGFLDKLEGKLLDNVFEFSDRVASEVMIPRQDMVCLYLQDSKEHIINQVKTNRHTRYPLCDHDKDGVIGMIHILDLIHLQENNNEQADLLSIKRDIMIVPENTPISHLIQSMRLQHTHMAIVVDEFGGTSGLITMEDMLEELVGEIYDEFEAEELTISKISNDEYLVNGRTLLEEISELLDTELVDDSVSTIGGYVFSRLGRKPVKGDEIAVDDFRFQVVETHRLRITKVRIYRDMADRVI